MTTKERAENAETNAKSGANTITQDPPTKIEKLTDQGKRSGVKYKVAGHRGLLLQVRGGSKLWMTRYTDPLTKAEAFFPLGAFGPENSLFHATRENERVRALVKEGKCPKQDRAEREAANRAEVLKAVTSPTYRQYVEGLKADLPKNPRSYAALIRYGVDLLGDVADMKPHEITWADLKRVLEPHWGQRGKIVESLKYVSRLLRMAQEDGLIENVGWRNPASLKLLRRKIGELPEQQHRKALSLDDLPNLLAALRRGRNDLGNPLTFLIVELLILTALRSSEATRLRWSYVNRERNVLAIPRAEMKGDMKGADKDVTHFEVPLTPAMIRVLDRARFLAPPEKETDPIFPSKASEKDEFFDDGTILDVLTTLGVRDEDAAPGERVTIHGFRSVFTGWARSQVKPQLNDDGSPVVVDGVVQTDRRWSKDLVLNCIAHVEKDQSDRAYDRQLPAAPRAGVMAAWSAFCETSEVVSLDDHRPHRAGSYGLARKRGQRRL
jgi:integrase